MSKVTVVGALLLGKARAVAPMASRVIRTALKAAKAYVIVALSFWILRVWAFGGVSAVQSGLQCLLGARCGISPVRLLWQMLTAWLHWS